MLEYPPGEGIFWACEYIHISPTLELLEAVVSSHYP
jgi:hypothetical protein